jgi:metal-dependent amidase/aminoacylase/carboxypeptidase family protein
MRTDVHERIRRTVGHIAEAAGATAEARIGIGVGVTYNDPPLTERMAPTLQRVAGEGKAFAIPLITGAEDFSVYQERIPGLFFFLGIVPEGQDPATAPPNHSPYFFADERALPLGVRAMANLALDYLAR